MTIPDLGSSLLDVAIRTAIVYVFLVVALRLGGKRDVGQLSILDLVVLLVIADAVQNAMVGQNTSLLGGLVAASVLVLLDRGLRLVERRSRRARRAFEGEPRMLIRDGIVLPGALRSEDISSDEPKSGNVTSPPRRAGRRSSIASPRRSPMRCQARSGRRRR